MRRRDFFAAAPILAGISPAAAQQAPTYARIGWLAHGDTMPRHYFDEALARLGWIEGKNLTIERRFSGSAGERVAADAAELVAWHPDVLIAMGNPDANPLFALTHSIPIVLVTTSDPVASGFATSLARPGGNVTGTASVVLELVPKLLELVHELLPDANRVSVLGDPRFNLYRADSAPNALGLAVTSRGASRPEELDAAFAAAAADRDQAMVVQLVALTFEERWRITALADRFRLCTVYPLREYVEAGGLISYGPAIRDNFTRTAVLVDKILRGANPGELPIEQPARFELVVNLKTAKALGITIPALILARADEVIE